MTPIEYGRSMIVLGVVLAIGWAGVLMDRRALRKQLKSKELVLDIWRKENARLREVVMEKRVTIYEQNAELENTKADLIACQTRLQRFARARGADGRITGRAL